MTGIWAWFLSTRAGRALLGFGALAAAFAAACLYWFQHGKRAQATADAVKAAQADAENRKAAQEAQQKSTEAVETTDATLSKMPDGGTQRVGDAAAGTPAGWLRDNANRDQAGP